ncbi:BolA family protein [Endothiovibrio diazotrophicus]
MMTPEERMVVVRERLTEALAPSKLEIVDQSEAHAGHASSGGAGHYVVDIVSAAFEGKNLVARHRLVYAALGELMQHEIHAVSMTVKSPGEV